MIRVEKVSKVYGPVVALDRISFEVGENQILGFLGPNGAGKSTAMKIITTYIAANEGTVTVDGLDVSKEPLEVRRRIGYLPETNPLYAEMRVEDYLRFCAKARGLSGPQLTKRFGFVVDACKLGGVLKKNINELSKGFKQRTGLAQALIHDPKILILDEPTSGLDPLQIIGIRELIHELAKTKTIIFSTHILGEVQATTDRIIIINEGQIIADGFVRDLKDQAAGTARLRAGIVAPRSEIETALSSIHGLHSLRVLHENDGLVTLDMMVSAGQVDARREVANVAASKSWPVIELTVPEVTLEDAFIGLISKSRANDGDRREVA